MIPLGVLASANVPAAGGGPLAVDDFNRADGGLGANWVTLGGTPAILSNNAHRGGGSNASAYHVTPMSGPDHYAQCVKLQTGLYDPSVFVRQPGTSAQTYYMGRWDVGQWEILRRVNGSFTSLATLADTDTAPITIRLEVEGSALRLYAGGVLKISITDSTITTGNHTGIRMNRGATFLDDFEAGDL